MTRGFERIVIEETAVPLAWAGSTRKMEYVNLGDALSPVLVALCSGKSVRRVPLRSSNPRLAAVGTIGHGLAGGTVWIWGTGSSNFRNPQAPAIERLPYRPPSNTEFRFHATRGPISRRL